MEDYFIKPQAQQDGGRARSRSRKTSSARLTPYQRHVKEFAKTYKGKNMMAAAAKAWKPKNGKKKTSRKTSRRTSRKQRGGADTEDPQIANYSVSRSSDFGRDDTAALKQILMQRLYAN